MTKADRIRATSKKHPKWSTARIGEACDCRPEYVRVVLRQRVNGASKGDITYREKFRAEHGVCPETIRSNARWHSDPEFRAKRYAYRNKRYWSDPAFRESEIQRHRAKYQQKKAQREAMHANPA